MSKPIPPYGTPEYDAWADTIREQHRGQARQIMLDWPDREPGLHPLYSDTWGPFYEWGDMRIRLPYTSRWGYDYRNLFDTRAEAIAWWKAADPS